MKRHSYLKNHQSANGCTPIVLLAVSASVCTPASGDEAVGEGRVLQDRPVSNPDNFTSSSGMQTSDSVWVLPLAADKKSNSQFLQKLLLSHGIEINLDATQNLDTKLFASTLKTATSAEFPVEEFDLTLLLELDTILAMPEADATATLEVSERWEVIWLDKTEEGGFNELETRERVQQTLMNQMSSPAAQWQLDVLISRPATEAELAKLKQQGKYPLPEDNPASDQSVAASSRERAQVSSPVKLPRQGALRRWLSSLPLDIDLLDDCSVQQAIYDYLTDLSRVASPPQARDKVSSAELVNGGVSAQWEARWLDCELGFDPGELVPQSSDSVNAIPDTSPDKNTESRTESSNESSIRHSLPDARLPNLDEVVQPQDVPQGFPSGSPQGLPSQRSQAKTESVGSTSAAFEFGEDVPAEFENLAGPQTQRVMESETRERVKQILQNQMSSPASQWQLDVLSSRPATAAELANLIQQGKYPLTGDNPVSDQGVAASSRKQPQVSSPAKLPRQGALRRWLSTLPLDVDLLDDCSVQQAIHDYLTDPNRVAAPPQARDKVSSAELVNGSVSAVWEFRWLDCELGFDLGELVPQRSDSVNAVSDTSPDNSTEPSIRESLPDARLLNIDEVVQPQDVPQGFPSGSPQGLPSQRNQARTESVESSSGLFGFGEDVPAGFENLAGPQTQYVDLYFNGRKAGSTSVTATPEVFSFDQPLDVAQMLHGVKVEVPLHTLLAETFDTNGHLICYSEGDPPGCGYIEADPVAAIYNEADLRVDVFVASELQNVQSLEQLRYLPVPGRKNTSILSVYSVTSKLEGEDASADVAARALLGFGRGHFSAEADFNSRTDRYRLREFKFTQYFNDYELEAGTYAFNPGSGLTGVDLLGAGFSTSYKSRIDLERAFSSELVVFLQRRSVVQIAIDDRIYAGASYDAGNQALDTTALPDGSYQVEIRIIDPVGGTRVETRAFTKSALIPPKGEAVVSMTAGNVLEFDGQSALPDVSDIAVVGFSLAGRVTDKSAYRLGLLQFGTQSLVQSEYIYLGQRISLQLSASAGDDNTLASSLRASYVKNGVSFNVTGSSFSSDFNTDGSPAYQLMFPDDYLQTGASLGRSFQKFSMGARANYRREEPVTGQTSSTQYALYYRQPVFKRKHLRGFFDANLQQDEIERRLRLQFSMYFGRNQYSGTLRTTSQRIESGDWEQGWGLDAAWHTPNGRDIQWGASAYMQSTPSDRSVGLSADVKHRWYAAGIASDWNKLESGDVVQNSVASLSAHLGLDNRGGAIGGSDFAQAGVIIAVDGEPRGERFDVVVNNIKRASGSIGSPQFIGLQPFESYAIKLVPQSTLSNGLGEDIYEFTLYPGAVERIALTAKQEVMLVGTLVDEQGEIIANALMQTEPNPLIVDSSGFVQAELEPGAVINVKLADGSLCEFTVPEPGDEDILVLSEPIKCRPTSAPQ